MFNLKHLKDHGSKRQGLRFSLRLKKLLIQGRSLLSSFSKRNTNHTNLINLTKSNKEENNLK